MADNITLNSGSGGSLLRTDDDGTAHWQYIKVAFGADNTQTICDSSNPLPVILAANSGVDIGDVDVTTLPSDTFVVEAGALGKGVLLQGDDGTDRKNVAVDATSGNMQVDVVSALPAGTNQIGKLAANSGVDIGDVDVTSISAGSNLIGDVGIGVRTSGGTTIFRSIDLDETEEEVKATAGQVYWIHCMNLSAAKVFLKFYNATAATVVVGTTTPVLTFPVPTTGDTNGAGFNLAIPNGIAFGTAITVAATTGVADNDTGAPGANEVVLNMGYA